MKKNFLLYTIIAFLFVIILNGCTSNTLSEAALWSQDQHQHQKAFLPSTISKNNKATYSGDALFNEATFIDLYQQANPSVVNIQVNKQLEMSQQQEEFAPLLPNIPNIPSLPPFQFPDLPEGYTMPQQGQGSGFVYDKKGHIITNNHVIDQAKEITVIFSDGREVPATLVGADPDSDLAVIKVDEVEADQLFPITLADSDELQIGQWVVAIGNPFGLTGSMTTGIISGLGRILPAGTSQFSIPDIIQTDTAINPGNSGGPLLNLNGEVIGVNTAIASLNRTFAGVGYAVPANIVLDIVPELIANGRIEHPWLGISGRTLDRDVAEAMNLDTNQKGILITDVIADSPAFASNLQGSDTQITLDGQQQRIGGDVIVGIDDVTIQAFDDLLSYIMHKTEIEQTITLHILRNGEPHTVDITLAPRPLNE